MTLKIFKAVLLCVYVSSMFLMAERLTLAQISPHVPTEEELQKRAAKDAGGAETGYQNRSVEKTHRKFDVTIDMLTEELKKIHLTPARLCLILGGIGFLLSVNKNKRKIKWSLIWIISLCLIALGLLAIISH